MMKKRSFTTSYGTIYYWADGEAEHQFPQLVFLPGLTADHRLFAKQVQFFEGKYPLLVWDAPGHASSWPFELTFTLMDKARWLDAVLQQEGYQDPVIIGQSMGGYVGQAYAHLFPDKLRGFISIDSAPLQRRYVTSAEIWLLKRMEGVYRHYPWKALLRSGTKGVATSDYGRRLMYKMMMVYDGNQERYAKLSGHGFWMLADAMEADLPYEIRCPALLICGERDHAGSTMRYNRAWHRETGIPIEWIPGAGHNSNTDALQQFYVSGGHEAIVEPRLFDYVQEVLKEQKSGMNPWSSRLVCGKCCRPFSIKTRHGRVCWECRDGYKKDAPCKNTYCYEEARNWHVKEVMRRALDPAVVEAFIGIVEKTVKDPDRR